MCSRPSGLIRRPVSRIVIAWKRPRYLQASRARGRHFQAPDDQRAAMYPQLAAHAKRLASPVPDTYDPRMLPMIQKIAAGAAHFADGAVHPHRRTGQPRCDPTQRANAGAWARMRRTTRSSTPATASMAPTGQPASGAMIGGPQAQQEPRLRQHAIRPGQHRPELAPEIRAQIAANPINHAGRYGAGRADCAGWPRRNNSSRCRSRLPAPQAAHCRPRSTTRTGPASGACRSPFLPQNNSGLSSPSKRASAPMTRPNVRLRWHSVAPRQPASGRTGR